MRTASLLGMLFLAPLCSVACATQPHASWTPVGSERSLPEGLAALAGSWETVSGDGAPMHETWMAPAGDNMTGSLRWFAEDGSVRMFELITITAEADGVRMRLRHFDGDLTPWSREAEGAMEFVYKDGPAGVHRFRAVERGGSVVDLTYDLTVPDRMTSRLRFEDRETLEIDFQRVN